MDDKYHPSNRLYRGELDGKPLEALQAIIDELNYEANRAGSSYLGTPPDEQDIKFSEDLRKDARGVLNAKIYFQEQISEAYIKIADDIENKKLAGDYSECIAEALRDGDWSRCAI